LESLTKPEIAPSIYPSSIMAASRPSAGRLRGLEGVADGDIDGGIVPSCLGFRALRLPFADGGRLEGELEVGERLPWGCWSSLMLLISHPTLTWHQWPGAAAAVLMSWRTISPRLERWDWGLQQVAIVRRRGWLPGRGGCP
jgi:hypothetical protein